MATKKTDRSSKKTSKTAAATPEEEPVRESESRKKALQELLARIKESSRYPERKLVLDLNIDEPLGIDSKERFEIVGALLDEISAVVAQHLTAVTESMAWVETLDAILERRLAANPALHKRSSEETLAVPSALEIELVSNLAQATAEKLGGKSALGFAIVSDQDMVKAVSRRFLIKAISALKKSGVTDKEIAELVINPRTLSHRKASGQRLTVEESDRAARVARVLALAEQTFVDRDKAQRWLRMSLKALGGERPIDVIATDAGARLVEEVLAKIAWGVAA